MYGLPEPTASWNGQNDFGVQPQPSAEQGVLCCKRSFMQQKTYLAMFFENIKIRLKSGRTLTGLKRLVRWINPYTAVCGWICSLTDNGGWTFPCSMKRKRPFPLCGEVGTCPYGSRMDVVKMTHQRITSESGCKITALSWAVE